LISIIQLSSPDIFLSHDWPQSIEHYGDIQKLLSCKPWFRADVSSGKLGSPALMGLLKTLQPTWWFAAHLHVCFKATVVHEEHELMPAQPQMTVIRNPEEIIVDADSVQLEKGLGCHFSQFD
jgi:lariat debranching enzyme